MCAVTIITICFNNLSDVQKTCESVDRQTYKTIEHWIINGSSESAIANWLEQTPQPSYRKWINERDKGISDAFNKGIEKASFEVTQLLNSGDCLATEDVIMEVAAMFEKDTTLQWISGNIQLMRGGKQVIVGKPFDKHKVYRGMRSVSHPTWFVKKEVYDRVGLYSSEYKIAMDYDMMCRIANEPYAYLNKVISIFDDTGVSSNNYLKSLKENRKVYEAHFGFSFKLVIWQFRLRVLHYLIQTSLGKWLFGLKKKLGLENF